MDIKRRFGHVLERDNPITSHSFRKTGYLFAAWGRADMDTAMKSARHKNFSTAQLYMGDAAGQLEIAKAINPDAEHEVPRFKMSILMNETSARRTIEATFRKNWNLLKVAQNFMKLINVSEHHQRKNSPLFVMQQAIQFTPDPNVGETLNLLLTKHLAQPIAEEVRTLMAKMLQEERNKRIAAETMLSLSHEEEETKMGEFEQQQDVDVEAPQSKKRIGIDLEGRKCIMQKKTRLEDKLTMMTQLEKEVPLSLSDLTPAAKTWYITVMKPVLLCFKNHCNENIPTFIEKWALHKGISKFKTTCCIGSGSHCSTT